MINLPLRLELFLGEQKHVPQGKFENSDIVRNNRIPFLLIYTQDCVRFIKIEHELMCVYAPQNQPSKYFISIFFQENWPN